MMARTRRELSEIKELVSSINTALIVREPGTALAADAYDGLRRQVSKATTERRAHLVELVRLLEAIDNGVSGDALRRLVEGWADQAGLSRLSDPTPPEAFEIIDDGDRAGPLEVINPAWVAGDVLIKQGLARRTDSEPAAAADSGLGGEEPGGVGLPPDSEVEPAGHTRGKGDQ